MTRSSRTIRNALGIVLVAILSACTGVGPFAIIPSGTLVVTPRNPVLGALGSSVQLQIASADLGGAQADITWSSNNPAVARVSDTGVATAVGDGAATITARVGELTGTTTVTVEATIINTVRITGVDQADANTVNNTAAVAITIRAN